MPTPKITYCWVVHPFDPIIHISRSENSDGIIDLTLCDCRIGRGWTFRRDPSFALCKACLHVADSRGIKLEKIE